MDRQCLRKYLTDLHDVILEERQAAKELAVSKMLKLTAKKEELIKEMLKTFETVDSLSPEEKELSNAVFSENLRNAYFFLSALNLVRQSMDFFGNRMFPEGYEENGSKVTGRFSGALLSGRI